MRMPLRLCNGTVQSATPEAKAGEHLSDMTCHKN